MMLDFHRRRIADAASRGFIALGVALVQSWADLVRHAPAEHLTPLRSRHPSHRVPPPGRIGDPHMLPNLRQDVVYALRNLRRAPGFTGTVLVTLALGIGANVAIFSVVNGVLLRPLPFNDADRVIQLSNGDSPSTLSEPEVVDLGRDARTLGVIGAYSYADGNVTGGDDAERVRIARVDAGFFPALQPKPFLGRTFTPDEDKPGAPDVVVISYGLWQRRFAMDRSAVGRQIIVNDAPRTVIGVMPPNFDYPTAAVAVWTPLRLDQDAMITRNNHYLRVIARLSPDASVATADAEVRSLRDRWARDYPETYRPSEPLQVDVKPIRDRVVGTTAPYLIALLGAVGFVLLIACLNVANLLLARAEVRRKEMMIRSALGATRWRIAAQLSFETAMLTLAGGLLGVATAWPALRLIVAAAPASVPRLGEIRLDTSALVFAAAVCVLTGVLFALAPIVSAARMTQLSELSSGSRNASQSGGKRARGTRTVLVISEVALAVMMLAGATLFVRTLMNLQRTDLGFGTDGILTARVSLPRPAYTGEKGSVFTTQLIERVRALPGVTTAAAMAWTPIVDGGGNWSLVPEGSTISTIAEAPTAVPQQVTPGFFTTMRIPVRHGREFTDRDRAGSDPVVIVNETLARGLWGDAPALGRRLRLGTDRMPFMTVVGVVGDTRVDGLTEPAPPAMYFPHDQAGTTAYFTSLSMTLLVRSQGGTEALVPAVRQIVRDLDAKVPLSEIRTMTEVVGSSIARHRFTTLLLGGLAAFAVLLAAIGIYGIIAYSVAQRRYEFGVRLALGAGRGRVLGLVVREGMRLALTGLALGVAGVFGLGRLLSSILVGVGAVDVTTLLVVGGVLMVVAILALAVPALRAMSVDPTEALRSG
jgi:predicted permease